MNIDKIAIGKNAPDEVNVIIEIPAGGLPVKYEVDKESGSLFVDRFLSTAMFYPANYGFIPHTLSDDGDPADVLVVTPIPVIAGSVIPVRPIGVLLMEDESGMDEKIIAVPISKLTPYYENINSYEDLPRILLEQISHFFERYKDLEKGKWVKITGFAGAEKAKELINQAIEAGKN
jgi:inorganic pyrophosphatase